jgi:hypothetical protein
VVLSQRAPSKESEGEITTGTAVAIFFTIVGSLVLFVVCGIYCKRSNNLKVVSDSSSIVKDGAIGKST